MNAKEAYELAASKADITSILVSIESAAQAGKTFLKVAKLNNFQMKALTDLGYMVIADHTDDRTAILGSMQPNAHRIDWNFPGEKSISSSFVR